MDQLARLFRIPYRLNGRTEAGADCWGLACLAALWLFDLRLPEFPEDFLREDDGRLRETFRDAVARGDWQMLAGPVAGAVVVFTVFGEPWHCGLMLDHRHFIHSLSSHGAAVGDLQAVGFRNRVDGFYQWTPPR